MFKNEQQFVYNHYLQGGGQMGELTRSFHWSNTVVGSPDQWSQSLLNTISIMFNSKYPMFIWWGPELIQFYNDAYRPLMGIEGKHPKALGQKGEECWPEIWSVIKPLIDQALEGEAVWEEDQLIPIYRNNRLEDVYWTFGYNGIRDETGKIAGVLVICNETTEKVKSRQKIITARKELEFIIEATELATWDYNPLTDKMTGNDRFKTWFGLPLDSKTDFDLATINQAIIEEDKERVNSAIQKALKKKADGNYDIINTIINPIDHIKRVIKTKGKAIRDAKGNIIRFMGTMQDITEIEQVKFQKEKEQLEKQQKDMQAIQKQRIFWATLNAQEEERKRIAESLHNGLGQLLYGVKLSLERLDINKEFADPKWLENKQRTDQLLAQSIKESRQISHDLSPAILNDFGLKEAIKSICQQFTPSILINSKFIGFRQRLHKNIEIAIYRTVQELLMNIVKHAKASKAAVKIEITKKAVVITVQDNGIGFNNTNKSNGIGLVTIRNKVKLLNGEFTLTSTDEKGSIIRISVPYETERDDDIH